MRLPIPDDCGRVARELIAHGLDPNEHIEFVRNDVVCVHGTARAFATRTVVETPNGPRHAPYRPFDRTAMVRLGLAVDPPVRPKRRPARLIVQE
jgi:hypothetical protein